MKFSLSQTFLLQYVESTLCYRGTRCGSGRAGQGNKNLSQNCRMVPLAHIMLAVGAGRQSTRGGWGGTPQ